MLAHSINRAFLREKSSFFIDCHVWPLQNRLDPEGWLRNFNTDEEEFAIHLLNGFCYYSDSLLDQLFVSAFVRLCSKVMATSLPSSHSRTHFQTFCDEIVVTYPTGESPSEADSGHLFARRARDLLGIPEERILSPENAIGRAKTHSVPAIVFVDDFVGSGSQFLTTINRNYGASKSSFVNQSPILPPCYYIPLFCTAFAQTNALSTLPSNISCEPLHIIGNEYNALNHRSVFWPPSLSSDGPAFIERVSRRLGLDDTNGSSTADWRGFCSLGLGIAFEHQIPDACLPIFYTTKSGWRPLWRRS